MTRDTSIAAAESIAELTPQLRAQIFEQIRLREGATCDELEISLDLKHQTASARVHELMKEGKIVDSGERRPTSSGAKAIVWKVAPPAVEKPVLILPQRRPRSIVEVRAAGGYKIIYADPSWMYVQGGRGSAENHYTTTDTSDMAALPVEQIAADDAVLFMWGTWPQLPDAIPLMNAWGFKYKTLGFLWVKTNPKSGTPFWGGGFWTRSNTEFCLLGVRGKPKRISAKIHQLIETWDEELTDNVLRAPVAKHSAKPPEVRDRILQLMGDLPAIELFARCKDENEKVIPGGRVAAGWDQWGNECESDVDFIDTTATSLLIINTPTQSEAQTETQTEADVQTETQGDQEMANLPPNIAKQVADAKVTGGGTYIEHGDYDLMVTKWEYQELQDKVMVHEFVVISAKSKKVKEGDKLYDSEPNPVDSVCSYAVNFDGAGKLSAAGNVRAVVLGLFGFKENEVKGEVVQQTLGDCCDGKANGMILRCSTYPKEIKSNKGNFITGMNWECYMTPGQGANRLDLAAERMRVLKEKGAEAAAALARQHMGSAPEQPAAPSIPAPTPAPAPSVAAPPPPPPAPPPAVEKPWLIGWTPHPQNPAYFYKGAEVKTEEDIRRAAGQ